MVLKTVENHSEVIHFSLLYLSHLFCLLNPNREGSQGTQRQWMRGRERWGGHQAKPLLCVCGCWWAMLRRYREGFLQGSSLLWMGQLFSAHSGVPVPAERPCTAKKKDRQSLTAALALTMPAFMRVFRSEVTNRLQDNWGDHMLYPGQSFCFSIRLSPPDTVHLRSTPRLAGPDPSRLAFGWPRGPQGGVGGLGVPGWMHC